MGVKLLNFKSRLRKKLLTLYFTNPDQKYYVNELARLLDDSAGNIRNELMGLVNDGLFSRETVGNLVFYKLNQNHPYYSELKSIIQKSIGVEGGMRDALQPISNIFCAFIFGSFARGDEHQRSDIDLFVIGSPNMDAFTDVIHEQENLLNREINYHIYSKEEWTKKSKEGSSFILNIKSKPKIFLIGDEKCL